MGDTSGKGCDGTHSDVGHSNTSGAKGGIPVGEYGKSMTVKGVNIPLYDCPRCSGIVQVSPGFHYWICMSCGWVSNKAEY